MIVLLDTSQDLTTCAAELNGHKVGQLLTPLTRYTMQDPALPWAIDNGAFSRLEEKSFLSLLKREEHHKQNCLFVTAPDVVGSAARTFEVFQAWQDRLSGWPIAYACQDGQEHLPTIPWPLIAAVFIGGSTDWKTSVHAERIIKTAREYFGKWVHVGRVNTQNRFDWCCEQKVDSIDGTGISRYSHMREKMTSDLQGKLCIA